MAARAAKELNRVANEGKTQPPKKADPVAVAAALKELIASRNPSVAGDAVFAPTLAYVAGLCASLQDTKNFEFDEWNGVAVTPYFITFLQVCECCGCVWVLLGSWGNCCTA